MKQPGKATLPTPTLLQYSRDEITPRVRPKAASFGTARWIEFLRNQEWEITKFIPLSMKKVISSPKNFSRHMGTNRKLWSSWSWLWYRWPMNFCTCTSAESKIDTNRNIDKIQSCTGFEHFPCSPEEPFWIPLVSALQTVKPDFVLAKTTRVLIFVLLLFLRCYVKTQEFDSRLYTYSSLRPSC